jgi:hypothetical protein
MRGAPGALWFLAGLVTAVSLQLLLYGLVFPSLRNQAATAPTHRIASPDPEVRSRRREAPRPAADVATPSVIGLRDTHAPRRLLLSIVSFNTGHMEHTHTQLKNARDMCEGDVDVTVHLHTTVDADNYKRISEGGMLWCTRIGASLPLRIIVHKPAVGKSLPCVARTTMWEAREGFDWFLQTEDDVDVRLSHLREFWRIFDQALVESKSNNARVRPGWVIYDRAPDYLVITNMGSANSTARTHSTHRQVGGHPPYFTMPGYMCGFLLPREDVELLHAMGAFTYEQIKDEFANLPWPMEQCNGMRFNRILNETRWLPVNSFRRLMVNHLTNKCVSSLASCAIALRSLAHLHVPCHFSGTRQTGCASRFGTFSISGDTRWTRESRSMFARISRMIPG